MPAPFWVHCNICAAQFGQNVQLYMLSCSHLLCKSCMKQTDRGKKCPFCKKAITFMDVSKLPDNVKASFKPNIASTMSAPLKMINFQRVHQKNLFKLMSDFKSKCKKAAQVKAKLEQEVYVMKQEYKKMVTRRKMMQEKLKEIYMKNQSKPRHRSIQSTPSPLAATSFNNNTFRSTTSFSSSRPIFNSTKKSSSTASNSFFDVDAPMLQSQQSSSFGQNRSDRKPFFA